MEGPTSWANSPAPDYIGSSWAPDESGRLRLTRAGRARWLRLAAWLLLPVLVVLMLLAVEHAEQAADAAAAAGVGGLR